MNQDKRSILLYGRTNSGKTAQLGLLAEHIFKTTGKRTRLYTGDRGGTRTIVPHIKLGIVESIEMGATNPYLFLNKAVRGFVKDDKGKWVPGSLENVGLIAYEGLRSFAESLMQDMAAQAAKGINIGGGQNVAFTIQAEGETLKVGGGNQTHYRMAQDRMTEEVWESQKLDVPWLLWTSSVSKDEDTTAAGKILGPDVIGKALTAETPRWFTYTFRLDVLPARGSEAERHILYLGNHVDAGSGGAAGLGNIRLPLDAPKLDKNFIEPANLIDAIKQIDSRANQAESILAKKMGLEIKV